MIYPGATWKPLKQNATQGGLFPSQVIFHSETSPDIEATWGYFEAGSGGLHTESHFLVGYDGSVIQAISTDRTADAQWAGNAHAISIETASNGAASDSWTPAQAGALVALTRWLIEEYPTIARRECRTWDDPGIGYHRLFAQWNQSNHSCPGNLRVKQFPILLAQIVVDQPTPAPSPAPVPLEEDMAPRIWEDPAGTYWSGEVVAGKPVVSHVATTADKLADFLLLGIGEKQVVDFSPSQLALLRPYYPPL